MIVQLPADERVFHLNPVRQGGWFLVQGHKKRQPVSLFPSYAGARQWIRDEFPGIQPWIVVHPQTELDASELFARDEEEA